MQCLEPIFIIFIYEKCAQVVFYIYTTAKNHMIILQANLTVFSILSPAEHTLKIDLT